MHVRSLSVQEQWLRIENAIPFVREAVEPGIESIDGNCGLCMLVDQRKPQAIVIAPACPSRRCTQVTPRSLP